MMSSPGFSSPNSAENSDSEYLDAIKLLQLEIDSQEFPEHRNYHRSDMKMENFEEQVE